MFLSKKKLKLFITKVEQWVTWDSNPEQIG